VHDNPKQSDTFVADKMNRVSYISSLSGVLIGRIMSLVRPSVRPSVCLSVCLCLSRTRS